MTIYANSEDFQILAITTMVSSFVAEWNDRSMKLYHEWSVTPFNIKLNIAEIKSTRQDKIMGVGIANGQGESLVRFLCSALPNRPSRTVVVVNGGQDSLSQTLYWQKWPKSVFEIVVRIEKRQAQPFDVTNGYTDVSNGTW